MSPPHRSSRSCGKNPSDFTTREQGRSETGKWPFSRPLPWLRAGEMGVAPPVTPTLVKACVTAIVPAPDFTRVPLDDKFREALELDRSTYRAWWTSFRSAPAYTSTRRAVPNSPPLPAPPTSRSHGPHKGP